MKMNVLRYCLIIALLVCASAWSFGNTKGTPLGGLGTGYVVFDARSGDFAASGKMPPAASDGVSEFDNKKSSSSGFHFFANGQSIKKAKTNNEDAKCPLYSAIFDPISKVTFVLRACGPFIPGDSPLYDTLSYSPLAFFEVVAVNDNATAVEAAVALEFFNTNGSTSLLGGGIVGTNDAAANNKALLYEGTGNIGNLYMQTDCDIPGATFSAGTMGDFLTTGTLTNGTGSIVAAKCTVPANGTARFKIVMSWWRTFVSTVDRYGSGKVDEENYYYHNFFNDSKAAGQFGMKHFDAVVNSVRYMVDRVMGSNFPDWYKDRLLNNTYTLIHNSQCAKDGRVAFWEGRYPIIGTIDQAEHAAVFYTFNWPNMQWHELQYWARTSHTGVNEEAGLAGQIHHDVNMGPAGWTDDAHFMCPWDNYTHEDYFYDKNTTPWADLNCMFIFKAYELMMATGNKDSMKIYFPYIKRTGDRLMRHAAVYSSPAAHLPLASKSSYDTDHSITPNYNGGLALASYLAVADMAKYMGEDSVATRYKNWYDLARVEYKTNCNNSSFGQGKDISEGDVAGYSWAHFLGLPAIMDSDFVVNGCKRLWDYYSTQTSLRTKLARWHFYSYDHWGGAAIAINKPDTAMIIHKWDYDYYYTGNPPYVFWQDLFESNAAYMSYITAPCVWRSYFQMTGYMLDNAHNRLWIRPSIPTIMGKKITAAPLLNPHGWGTLFYDENPSGSRIQGLTVSFDSLVTIKEIVLKNNATVAQPGVSLKQNGVAVTGATVTTEGAAFEKNIRVTLAAPIQIGPQGLDIGVYNGAIPVGVGGGCSYTVHHTLSFNGSRMAAGLPVSYTVDAPGRVSLELISLSGAKIGTLMAGNASSGENSFVWDGRLKDGARVGSSIAIVRLTTSAGAVSKLVFVGK